MKNSSSLIVFIILFPIILFAQTKITSIEQDAVKQRFLKPQNDARPHVWWHWMGSNFSLQGITKDLEAMKLQGIGGATIFNLSSAVQESQAPTINNPWPHQTYRSKAYWAAVKHAAAEAKRLGIEIGLHNTVGYSTTGGPWIDEEKAMKKLVWNKVVIKANQQSQIKVPKPAAVINYGSWGRRGLPPQPSHFYKDIAYLAIPLKDSTTYDSVLNVTNCFDSSGLLIKNLPDNDLIVYRLGYAPTMANPHPAPDDVVTKSLEVDKINKEANLYHWQQVLNPLQKEIGQYLGSSFRHILIDSYEAGNQNWTNDFIEQFIKLKGYDPLPWLLTMNLVVNNWDKKGEKQRIRINKDLSDRFEWDYKDVINTLFNTHGWAIGRDAIKKLNLQFQFEPYGGPFNLSEGVGYSDLPMGEFWTSGWGVNNTIAYAARAANKKIIGAEAFTGWPTDSKFTETPEFLKASAQKAFANGINRLTLHHWVHQPFDDNIQPGMGMGWWGTHFGRHQIWGKPAKAFIDFLSRSQFMLQYGSPVSHVLALDNASDDADLMSVNQFLNTKTYVDANRVLHLENGRAYKILVMPKSSSVLPELMQKIKPLIHDGLMLVGSKPTTALGLKNYPVSDSIVNNVAGQIWNNKNEPINYGKGQVFKNLQQAKVAAGIVTEVTFNNADSAKYLKWLHRADEKADVYFVVNLCDKKQTFNAWFANQTATPEFWNPEDGSLVKVPVFNTANGNTNVLMSLDKNQSIFVVFPKNNKLHVAHYVDLKCLQGDKNSLVFGKEGIQSSSSLQIQLTKTDSSKSIVELKNEPILQLNNDWMVSFYPPYDAAFKIPFTQLTDFSKHEDARVKYFSGKAVFLKKLLVNDDLLAKSKQGLLLNIGTINGVAIVKVNGKAIDTLWYPPYETAITGLLKKKNDIEIELFTTWANRLIGDEQEPADFEWGNDRGASGRAMKGYPDWFVNKTPRPAANRKTFSVWYYYRKDSPLIASGITGPVNIVYRNKISF